MQSGNGGISLETQTLFFSCFHASLVNKNFCDPFESLLFDKSQMELRPRMTIFFCLYRRLCSPLLSSSTLYPDLPPSKWLLLWRFPLRPQSRNIWYRLIHNKLPCRSNLYLPSKLCPVCKNLEETPSHFLFDCPQKLVVESLLWDSQFKQPFSKYSLRRALFLLDFPKCRSDTVHAPSIFIGIIFLAIWRNHWAVIFDYRPFLTDVTIRCVNQLLSVSLQESLLSSGISPLPLPHLQLSYLSSS